MGKKWFIAFIFFSIFFLSIKNVLAATCCLGSGGSCTCSSIGSCTYTCNSGWFNDDGIVTNGCENQAPQWFTPSENSTNPKPGDAVKFSVNWTDVVGTAGMGLGINYTWFSWNASGANCDTWINISFTERNNANSTWHNETQIIPTACSGKKIAWKQYANDSANEINVSEERMITVKDITSPQYSLNSTNSTIAGTAIEFRLYWQDNVGLDKAITSLWNGSSWVNASSWCSFSVNSGWCNQTFVVNETPQQLWWKQYANDTSNNWNTSMNFSLITVKDITSPQYSLNSTNSTIAGTAIEHRLKWTDDFGLSGFIFSFINGTNITTIYTFSDTTNNKAYNGSTSTEPPSSLSPTGEQEFSSYSEIQSSDNVYFETNSTNRPYHKFNITINESLSDIDHINISWEGHTSSSGTINLYVYNFTSGSWGSSLASNTGTTDFWLNKSLNYQTTNFFDIIQNGKMSILVQDESNSESVIESVSVTPFHASRRAVCRDGQGNLHVAWLNTSSTIGYANSTDGVTWTKRNFATCTESCSIPSLHCNGNNITIAWADSYSTGKGYIMSSNDNGNSWFYVNKTAGDKDSWLALAGVIAERYGEEYRVMYQVEGATIKTCNSTGGNGFNCTPTLYGYGGGGIYAYKMFTMVVNESNPDFTYYFYTEYGTNADCPCSSLGLCFAKSSNGGATIDSYSCLDTSSSSFVQSAIMIGNEIFLVTGRDGSYDFNVSNSSDGGNTWTKTKLYTSVTLFSITENSNNQPRVYFINSSSNFTYYKERNSDGTWGSEVVWKSPPDNMTAINAKRSYSNNRVELLLWNGSHIIYNYTEIPGISTVSTDYIEVKVIGKSWQNDTWQSFPTGGLLDWSNVTKRMTDKIGKVVYWKVYANDTSDNWNESEIFSYTTTPPFYLEVELSSPPLSYDVNQNSTFTVNATVYCRNGNCGNVYGTVRYNASSPHPDTEINTTQDAKPFFIQESPSLAMKTCPTNPLDQDEFCNLTWIVNSTGDVNSAWKIGVLFNSSLAEVQQNHTQNSTITIVSGIESLSLAWNSIDFGFLIPNTPAENNPAPGNENNLYNITNTGTCSPNLWIKGVDLQNLTFNSFIAVGNLSWSNSSSTYNPSTVYPIKYNYEFLYSALQPNSNLTTYYWLSVPSVYAGIYKGTITICGNCSSLCD